MDNTLAIKSIEIEGLYYRYNMQHQFFDGVNILYGKNGTGKTTLLHILANVLNKDYSRFVYLPFEKIEVTMIDDEKIIITAESTGDEKKVLVNTLGQHKKETYLLSEIQMQEKADDDEELHFQQDELFPAENFVNRNELAAAYFPAFRAILEAWSLSDNRLNRSKRIATFNSFAMHRYEKRQYERLMMVTKLSRKLFGAFVPLVSYPSLLNVQEELSERVAEAQFKVARVDNNIVSEAFVDILKTLTQSREAENESNSEKCSEIIDIIKKYSDQLEERSIFTELSKIIKSPTLVKDSTAQHVLEVYLKSLQIRVKTKEETFREIDQYLLSVNTFFRNTKKIGATKVRGMNKRDVFIEYSDGTQTDLLPLSSGERQIVTMIYAATRMNQQHVILIDEPELSLHPDWQRELLKSMLAQLGNRQIIVCTHSPIIGANYDEHMNELVLQPRGNEKRKRKSRFVSGGIS